MSLSDKIKMHRLRKKLLIGSNLIAIISLCFYILIRMAIKSGNINFNYWTNDMIYAGLAIICLLSWKLYIHFSR